GGRTSGAPAAAAAPRETRRNPVEHADHAARRHRVRAERRRLLHHARAVADDVPRQGRARGPVRGGGPAGVEQPRAVGTLRGERRADVRAAGAAQIARRGQARDAGAARGPRAERRVQGSGDAAVRADAADGPAAGRVQARFRFIVAGFATAFAGFFFAELTASRLFFN